MSEQRKKIAIIGGGAAGMMAAATILESQKDCEVFLFDKNKQLGTKVIISGGGRCNVTTGITDRNILHKNYPRGSQFLKAAFSKFPPQKVYNWFEEHGVPLKTEEDLRVFPQSDDGYDIVGVFKKLFEENQNIHILYKSGVKTISKENEKFILTTKENDYIVDSVIIATGGNAYRRTGSTGDGYAFAQSLGHSISSLGPSLNSFLTKEKWPTTLSGISFPNAQLEYKKEKVKVHGPFLFTHFGISGPVTFSFAANIPYQEITAENPLSISFIADASKNYQHWDKELQEIFNLSPKKSIKNILNTFFPARFIETMLYLLKINPQKPAYEINKEERKKISHAFSGSLELTLINRKQGDEFVTAGGVELSEINAQTMESLLCPNLYFAGEIMNIDGYTGGFNLQASWATGYLAGKSVVHGFNV